MDVRVTTTTTTNQLTFDGQDTLAVHLDGKLVGHVSKGERRTPVRARSGNYSVGERVERGWRFEVHHVYARIAPVNERWNRERLVRLARGFERTRKAAVAGLVNAVQLIDEAVAQAAPTR